MYALSMLQDSANAECNTLMTPAALRPCQKRSTKKSARTWKTMNKVQRALHQAIKAEEKQQLAQQAAAEAEAAAAELAKQQVTLEVACFVEVRHSLDVTYSSLECATRY